ncbi:MAG: hypothetical protein ACTTKN_09915 [Phocaeicola sp.]|uniref:hypothetical protein n=1 Tax=Phocaeicola TaxID=909656 RepID=UPI00234E9749|nr:hypothetical protein [Phocaeicola oris]MCE2615494.1 hypothetical protein [Phocaeicola oris]
MKKLLYLFTICSMLLVSSCGTIDNMSNAMFKVKKGMTTEEVSRVLGKPDYRRFNEDMEEWQYERIPWIGYTKIFIVGFCDGKVVNFNSFREPNTPENKVNVEVNN